MGLPKSCPWEHGGCCFGGAPFSPHFSASLPPGKLTHVPDFTGLLQLVPSRRPNPVPGSPPKSQRWQFLAPHPVKFSLFSSSQCVAVYYVSPVLVFMVHLCPKQGQGTISVQYNITSKKTEKNLKSSTEPMNIWAWYF